jgi:drug/metabolite transporter (DMT)-like permease
MTVSDRVARRPARGYALAASGATLWAVNASLARYLLDDGVSAVRLAQLRSAGSWLILLALLSLARRDLLRVDRRELPALAFLGVAGLAMVHATYFLAIQRLQIGVAVTIEYLAPLLLLLWLRIAYGRRLRPSLWGAVGLSIVGCFLVVRAYDAGSLDGLGVAAAFGAAVSFAVYLVGSERAGRDHEPVTTLFWAFGFASLFWVVAAPWWGFPFSQLTSLGHLLLAAGVVVVGTLLPFICMVAALRHIPAARAAVVATLEPALAAVFAWFLHDERLAALQIVGGIAVIAAVILVQSRRPDLDAELAPPRADGRARKWRERAKQRI